MSSKTIIDRNKVRAEIKQFEGFQEDKSERKTTETKWSQEEKNLIQRKKDFGEELTRRSCLDVMSS